MDIGATVVFANSTAVSRVILGADEHVAAYLEVCSEKAGAEAIGNVARTKGMTQLTKDTGMGRESLDKTLSGEGNPGFATILKVMHALGLDFTDIRRGRHPGDGTVAA